MNITRISAMAAATVFSLGVLTACGTGTGSGPGTGAASGAVAGAVTATPAAVPPRTDPEVEFMKMRLAVGRPCHPGDPTEPPASAEPPEPTGPSGRPVTPRTSRPAEPLPVGEPPSQPPASSARPARPASEEELTSDARCQARLHAARIAKELDALSDPTPERVRAALKALGYTDGRINGLERTGRTTRFVLDLRLLEDPLCLEGEVTAGTTVIKPFGVASDVKAGDVKRPG
ncbi:hypothetical protein ABZ990_28845 [Streptomyces sp. NPDC046203]|uniref:hypothetical protein n=1 Tax=Streptomyces sp. NPDC046203 TaxID=3154602 RepID=UPI0033FF20C7